MFSAAIVLQQGLLFALGAGMSFGGIAAVPPAEAVPRLEAAAPALPVQSTTFDERAALELSRSVLGKPVGDHVLTDSAGRRISLASFRGKPLLVNFVYTGCSRVCPVTTRFLAKAVDEADAVFGAQKFAVLTIGFNLPFDAPPAMADFARRHGIDRPNWAFASPSADDATRLARDFGFSFVPAAGGFDHITQVTVVDAEGRVYRQVYGESFELPFLIEPLRQLVAGAPPAGLSLTQALDRVRILCTIYDPASGKYRPNYALFIEIIAGLSVIGGALLFLRNERVGSRATRRG